ncbi:procollagen C-endopeptidase enhancer 1-like [Coturnix japonica]|uniref:procollagen C-endopeptidase enhancer 1-like n=1 Tax=Coturnix japonica TaxID=93934 RepID=UPI000777AAE8|nr:procollagen C-endopeptidase enhancer 1-like [Coturnix japonica]
MARPAPFPALLLLLFPALRPAAAAPPNASRPVFLCGGEHGGDSGYIGSEGFPRHYPPHSNCTWSITVRTATPGGGAGNCNTHI